MANRESIMLDSQPRTAEEAYTLIKFKFEALDDEQRQQYENQAMRDVERFQED